MLENGSVLIHRSITAWEWYTDVPTRVLFEHLILTANWKQSKFRGEAINRGERICSLPSLEEETGLSVQQIRTAIRKLEKTGELKKRQFQGKTILSVINFEKFQKINRRATDDLALENADFSGGDVARATDEQQTINRRATDDQQGDNTSNTSNKAINKHISARARAYEENTDLSFALSRYVEAIGRDTNTPAVGLLKSFLGYNPEAEIALLRRAAEEKTAIRDVTNALIRLKGGTE